MIYSQYESAATTLDILRRYTCLPDNILNDLESHIDDTSNGMMMDRNLHATFDRFYWCLKPTEVSSFLQLAQILIFVEDGKCLQNNSSRRKQ